MGIHDMMMQVHREFNRRLGHLGTVVIAGGAVRDLMLGRMPKDYDVFVLTGGHPDKALWTWDVTGLTLATGVESYGLTEDMVGAYKYRGYTVQVILSDEPDVESLLRSFDWNICRVAFLDLGGPFIEGDFPDIVYNADGVPRLEGPLVLNEEVIRWPVSSLRRGVEFSRRYRMRLRPQDIRRLADAIEIQQQVKLETR